MSIHYACSCGQQITLPTGTAGRRARCRACGAVFTVPPPMEDDFPPATIGYASALAAAGPHDNDFTEAPSRGFLADLASSFLLPLVRGNIGIVISLTLALWIAGWVPFVGFFLHGLVGAYVVALSLATITHAAAGENDFPDVWIHNVWEDLILPAVQFTGSWLIVLLPLIVLTLVAWSGRVSVPAYALYLVGAGGVLLWPATVLAIAIGGTLNAARPDIVLRTAFASPLAYLTGCAGVAVAGAIQILPDYYPLQTPVPGILGAIVVGLIETSLGIYALLVASRIVGLYYHHFKERFPWTAE